jgi:YVTN family beta-propeller protein
VVSRRSLLTLPLAVAACKRGTSGFRGYAFIANEDGGAVAAVDLQAFAVAKHIALEGAPAQLLVSPAKPLVYALTPNTGTVNEIESDRLRLGRKLTAVRKAKQMVLAPTGDVLYLLASEPRSLVAIETSSLKPAWKLVLQEDPTELAVSPDGKFGAISSANSVRLVNLQNRQTGGPLAKGAFGAVRFLADGRTLVTANLSERKLSLFDVASNALITHLPLSLRPDHLCFNQDGGQLFITGEGMDAVVVVYPYHTPEVAETVLAGRAPGPMAASSSLLFVASPTSGDVSILNIPTRKLIAVVQVGSDPGFVAVTPDDQFALVLNRKSGDVAVLRVGAIIANANRFRTGALLTVIPVGSRPVSAAVRAII